jgi:uncharacterized membrane protein
MMEVPSAPGAARTVATERRIGRLLIAVTYLSVAFLAVGLVLMIAEGIAPTSGGPLLDLGGLAREVVALDPGGFLWLGLLAVIAAPIGRVIVAGVAYAGEADLLMVGISVAILVVIAVGVASAALVAA